jgi:hypothetical protein
MLKVEVTTEKPTRKIICMVDVNYLMSFASLPEYFIVSFEPESYLYLTLELIGHLQRADANQ